MELNGTLATSPNRSVPDTAGEADLQRLLTELDVTTTDDALTAIRTLRARAGDTAAPLLEPVTAAEPLAEGSDTRKLLEKLRLFASKIDSLNGTVASMEAQLQSLYSDRERLETEIGASEVDDVVRAFGDLQVTIQSMEKQLMTLYAGREVLEVELGKSDPQEIVALFRTVANLIGGAHQELVTVEAVARN